MIFKILGEYFSKKNLLLLYNGAYLDYLPRRFKNFTTIKTYTK